MRTDKDYTKTKPKISGYLRGITAETTSNRIDLSDSDFVYNTLTIRQSTSESGEFTVGAAIISSCNFTLWNYDGKFNDWNWTNSAAEIYLEFDTDKVYLGSYVIISHVTSGNTIKVEALDWLKVFDSHTLGEGNITWPSSAVSVINTIINTGVQNMLVSGLDAVTDITLSDPADTEMTNRDALAYIAQTLGRFITSRSDEATKKTTLRFSWYNTEEVYSAGVTFSHNLRTDNINVTGVEVTTADGETTESRGDSTGYVLKISDNPFISSDNISAAADNIAASCLGLTFRPGDFVTLSNVRIEAGDVLNIDTHEESGVLTLATDVTYKPAQVNENIVANAEEAEGDLQISKNAYIKKVIRDELNNPSSALGSAVGGAGGGTFETGYLTKTSGSKWVEIESTGEDVLGIYGGEHAHGTGTIFYAIRFAALRFKITSTPSGLTLTEFAFKYNNMKINVSGRSVTDYQTAFIERRVGMTLQYIPITVRVSHGLGYSSITYRPATVEEQLVEGDEISINIISF